MKKNKKITQPLQICIGPTICISQESWCLPFAGFFLITNSYVSTFSKVLLFMIYCVEEKNHDTHKKKYIQVFFKWFPTQVWGKKEQM